MKNVFIVLLDETLHGHSDENEKCGMDSWMLLTWIRTLGSSVLISIDLDRTEIR